MVKKESQFGTIEDPFEASYSQGDEDQETGEEIPEEPGDYSQFHKQQDAAFLYVLFTFQFFVCCFGTFMFFRKLFGSKEY